MNVKEETLRVLAWIRMFWMDPRLDLLVNRILYSNITRC